MLIVTIQNQTDLPVTNYQYDVFTTNGKTKRMLASGVVRHALAITGWEGLVRRVLKDVKTKRDTKDRKLARAVAEVPSATV